MADSNIGSLPQAENLDDDSLLVAEQQGQAVKVTGAQFKEFGKQAVIGQVQGYVDRAEAAADRAVDAVSAVTDMTVEASTLPSGQSATVTKTTKNGKVNLAFGLPRGEQGIPGPEGQTGPRGPQGPTGKGLTILGHYDTEAALRAAVTAPKVGDAYSVGTVTPYDTYIFDGVALDWKNYGPLSGGGGVLPDDVVTAEGGASMSFPLDLGDGPHVITFTKEEEAPLTAEDIEYSETQTVKDAIDDLKASVSNGKALIASAITDKGVDTAQDATFQQMADNIEQISGGSDTSDATATSFDILAGKTAYTAAGKVEGVIPTLLAQTITPGTADKTIANGQYLGGVQTIKGDPNLTSGNIKSGVTLFGVEGALESTFQATLTVTADIGAVVTATHSGGTKVEALSTTGTVVLELPLEGTWRVTAVRGITQYNTAIVTVTSHYNTALTARLYIEYYKTTDPLRSEKSALAATTVGNYALFGGGNRYGNTVDAYSQSLTRTNATELSEERDDLAATTVGDYALFGGGKVYNSTVDAYNNDLTHSAPTQMSKGRSALAATTVGDYALFGGGTNGRTRPTVNMATVDAYSPSLTRTTPTELSAARGDLAATTVGDYALFGGGGGASFNLTSGIGFSIVDAYSPSLTRTTPTELTARTCLVATTVGDYALFGGGLTKGNASSAVDAYNKNLTRTIVAELSAGRYALAATTVGDYALFCGGMDLNDAYYNTVDVYDETLTRTVITGLSLARGSLAATSVGNYGLLAGGKTGSGMSFSDTVDVYRQL